MANAIRVPALRVVQGGMEFYAFAMDSKTLRRLCEVSRRESGNRQGYQRYLSEERIRQVGDYIKKPRATFPNSVIVNFDKDRLRYEATPNSSSGVLIIQDVERSAWVIDGQHRLYGFEKSEGREFDLLVSAFVGLSVGDQATVFKVINSTQKGVNPSLIYDLIELTKDAEYQDERAHELVKALNEEGDSPWFEQIKMTGTGTGIISQAAFASEIKRVLQDTVFKEMKTGEQVKVLKDFFGAFRELFPDAWCSKKHVLSKTLGLAATMRLLPKVLIHCHTKADFGQRQIESILGSLPKLEIPGTSGTEVLDFSSRQLSAFGGKVGQKKLADLLEQALPKLRPVTS